MSGFGAGGDESSTDAIVQALGRSELFQRFTETGLQIFAGIAQEKVLPPGTPLFVQTMLGEALYVIVEGHVRIESRGHDGQVRQLCYLGAGDSLGEVTILRGGPRMCSATAESQARVLEIARRDVSNLLRSKPQACVKLMMSVAELLGNRMRECEPELRSLIG